MGKHFIERLQDEAEAYLSSAGYGYDLTDALMDFLDFLEDIGFEISDVHIVLNRQEIIFVFEDGEDNYRLRIEPLKIEELKKHLYKERGKKILNEKLKRLRQESGITAQKTKRTIRDLRYSSYPKGLADVD